MLIRFKTDRHNGVNIAENGVAYVFNSAGMFVSEEVLTPKILDGMINLPIISIITSNSSTDIMIHDVNDTEKFYKTKASGMECATKLTSSGDFVRMLRKNGKVEKFTYNQIVFVYRDGTNLASKLSLLNLEERV